MSFFDKFEKLNKDHSVVKNINKQLNKRNVKFKPNWYKNCVVSELYDDIEDTESKVYFLTIYNTKTKAILTTTAYCHDIDEFDTSIGRKICCNRMADHTDFRNMVTIDSAQVSISYQFTPITIPIPHPDPFGIQSFFRV